MKSIRSKLLVFLGLVIGVICIELGIISFIDSSNALVSNLGKTLPKIAEQAASNIGGRVEGQLSSMEVIAANDDITNLKKPWKNKITLLLKEVKRSGNIKMGIADKNGDVKYTDGTSTNVSDRTYFQNAMSGKANKNNKDDIIIDIFKLSSSDNISVFDTTTAIDHSVPLTGAYPTNLCIPLYLY